MKALIFLPITVLGIVSFLPHAKEQKEKAVPSPRIINIVNFIRQVEPRSKTITEDVLYETVVQQVKQLSKYHLPGTFLLQYDALINPRYQELLKNELYPGSEVGGWWEITQPHAEAAGLIWRGRFPWDWHANVGFSVGYSPAEREKLVDVYMKDFKRIFGYYPKSVGSWFMDALTLNYLYQKYGIVASCNCRDQIGTDGYTLWGGYWNQAYYPSKKNAYMPAQNEENQIPVPVFRMLGSDPIRQYDSGLGTNGQGVTTLEPAGEAGKDSAWVIWYFKEFVEGECMEYAYVQVGQENSFTWEKMSKGLEIQLPLIARLRDEKKVKVETLAESGKWFREHYKTTPTTSVTVKEDYLKGSDCKTVWFNSRFYRINLLWENGALRFRDIHMFDENFPSKYLTEKETSSQYSFFTFPFVDGFRWSSADKTAGLRFKAVINGNEVSIVGKDPVITDSIPGKLHISWPLKSLDGTFVIVIDEGGFKIEWKGKAPIDWLLDLTTADNADLPFNKITPSRVDCQFKGMDYFVTASAGSFSQPGKGITFRIKPEKNIMILGLSRTNPAN